MNKTDILYFNDIFKSMCNWIEELDNDQIRTNYTDKIKLGMACQLYKAQEYITQQMISKKIKKLDKTK